MSQFHRPRLSSAFVFALICIKTSLASPIEKVDRSRISTIGASEPVRVISSRHPPRDLIFPSPTGFTNEDGIHLARSPDDLSIVRASEPVNIIPLDDFPNAKPFVNGGSTTTDDGTTVTTTYNTPRDVVSKRNITSAVEPVNIIPVVNPPGRNLNGQASGISGISSITNDGTTLTTEFRTSSRNLLQTNSNATGSLSIVNTNNRTLLAQELNMGMNCEGSKIMCIGANQVGVMHTLRDYMYAIPDGYRYYAGQDIACMKHTVYPNPFITWGFYCAFMQGNIPAEGVLGTTIQLKMQQLIEHHCLGCGSVPFSDDNDPQTLGILSVNYVSKSECEGLCYYVPPGHELNSATVPKGMTLASS